MRPESIYLSRGDGCWFFSPLTLTTSLSITPKGYSDSIAMVVLSS